MKFIVKFCSPKVSYRPTLQPKHFAQHQFLSHLIQIFLVFTLSILFIVSYNIQTALVYISPFIIQYNNYSNYLLPLYSLQIVGTVLVVA